jgi:hypothetical protein
LVCFRPVLKLLLSVKFLLGVFLLAHYLIRALYKPEYNFFKEIGLEKLFYTITRLPSSPSK